MTEAETTAAAIRQFIAAAPPAQLLQVARDVRVLVGDDSVFNEAAESAFEEKNNKDFAAIKIISDTDADCDNDGDSQDRYVIVADVSRVKDTRDEYLEPDSEEVIKVDHVRHKMLSKRKAEDGELPDVDEEMKNFRAELSKKMKDYACNGYVSAAKSAVYITNSTTMEVVLSSVGASPKNFWAGQWLSRWTLDLQDGLAGGIKLSGKIRARVHYYEEGNVQLTTDWTTQKPIDAKRTDDPSELASGVVKQVEEIEGKYLGSLGRSYDRFSAEKFKDLRRKLPITQTKFNWSSTTHRVAAQLGGK